MSEISDHIAEDPGSALHAGELDSWHRLKQALERINASSPHVPESWLGLVDREPVKPFPVYHLATIEFLLASPSGASNLMANGLFHLILEGGGISWNLRPETLLELGALLKDPQDPVRETPIESQKVGEVAANLESLRKRGGGNARSRHAVCTALTDLLNYRDRISQPRQGALIPAFQSWLATNGFGPRDEAEKLLLSLHDLEMASENQDLEDRAIDEAEELVGTLRSLVGEADLSLQDPNDPRKSLERRMRTRQFSPPALTLRPRPNRPTRDARTEEAWTRQTLPTLSSTSGSLRARRVEPSLDLEAVKVWESRLPWLGLLLLTLFIAAGLFIALSGDGTEPSALDPREETTQSQEALLAEKSGAAQASAQDLANQFALAETIEERLGLISDLRYADALRDHFANATEEHEVEYVQNLGQGSVGAKSFYAFRVRFTSERNRLICLTESRHDGKLYVDWEAYSRWCSVSLTEFYKGKAPSAEVRLFVERGDYYNYAFVDGEEYQCYQLSSPDCEEILYGYVERGSVRYRLMEHLIEPGRFQRMTLTLQRPAEQRDASQFEISQLIAGDWVKDPNEALDESALARDMVAGETTVWLSGGAD